MNNKVLTVAVHPDDETLGCGGTLLKHKADGDEINWLICTSVDIKHKHFISRKKEIDEVSKIYEFDSVHDLQLKTTHVDEYTSSELIEKISQVINEIKPNIIYLPFKEDIHSDHKRIFEAAYSCTKSFRYPFIKKIYMLETISETEFAPSTKDDSFIPNVYVDISKYMEEKIKIINVYKKEIGQHPFPRNEKNIRALATLRGATCGCEYAESFMLLKEII